MAAACDGEQRVLRGFLHGEQDAGGIAAIQRLDIVPYGAVDDDGEGDVVRGIERLIQHCGQVQRVVVAEFTRLPVGILLHVCSQHAVKYAQGKHTGEHGYQRYLGAKSHNISPQSFAAIIAYLLDAYKEVKF